MDTIAILTSSFVDENLRCLERCFKQGIKIQKNPHGRRLSSAEILSLAKEAKGIIAGVEKYDKKVLRQLKDLRVISRCGTGLDNVDLCEAKRLGIRIFNTPEAPVQSVAELTILFMLSLLRKTAVMDRSMHSQQWKKEVGMLLQSKTVGIVGMGRIGGKVADLVEAFGALVIYTDIRRVLGKKNRKKMSLEALLASADIVTLHCGVVGGEKPLLGSSRLKLMKKSAYLVNTARGEIIDERALYLHLQKGNLAGAALDVFTEEPYQGPLSRLENVILTPHVGSNAVESRARMEIEAVRNLLEGLRR